MKVHHYTNLETLALILHNRNIRFNRLDKVDDIEEGNIISDGVNPGKYTFVSCWTEAEEENISLWKMYSGNGIGVRISLEQDMFKDYLITDGCKIGNSVVKGIINSKVPVQEFEQKEYFVLPIFDLDSGLFYKNIEYVEDVNDVTRNIVQREALDNEHFNVKIYWGEIGKYKHKRWSFQEESRYTIFIVPKNPFWIKDKKKVGFEMNSTLYNGVELSIDSYYLELKQEVLDEMTITLNPTIKDAQKILVESLCAKYAPKATIRESDLKIRY